MLGRRLSGSGACVILVGSLFGCGGSPSSPEALPSIIQQPISQTVTIPQVATFSVTATGGQTLAYQWQQNGQPISGATKSSYTTSPTTTTDDDSQFQVVVSNSGGQVMSVAAVLSVHPPPDVTTFHNDKLRTGLNSSETYLTPQNVNAAAFGKVGFLSTDSKVDAQPLYLSNVAIPGSGAHNVVYVVTERDSIYAFDADTFALLWQASALAAGETPSDDRQCSEAETPELGITSTPVIDRSQGPNGAIYLVAATEDSGGTYHFRLHALDVGAGTELLGGPKEIQAQYPGTGDGTNGVNVVFDSAQYLQRAALLSSNGIIYTAWASHCDFEPYTGWVIGYDESTLAQTTVLNLTANGTQGGIWMAGDGPAADDAGNVYLLDGNGLFDTTLNSNGFPSQGDFGNAFVKIAPTAPAAVTDFFAPNNTAVLSAGDWDIGSGGILLLPDQVDRAGKRWHLAVGSGKTGMIYVVDRDDMGKFSPTVDNIRQEIPACCPPFGGLYGGMWSTPAYFNSTLYFGAQGEPIEAFSVANAELSLPYSMLSTNAFPFPGATPSISSNGVSNALLWAVENGTTGILHAYDATNLAAEVYNSGINATRDQFGSNKFIVPMITNGKVYVGTPTGVAVFGLLPTAR